jgi:hypothetical protein
MIAPFCYAKNNNLLNKNNSDGNHRLWRKCEKEKIVELIKEPACNCAVDWNAARAGASIP